jgi:hypothetical protein
LSTTIGRKHWAIAEGYIPLYSHGPAPQMTSHEAVCILNAADETAHVEITLYYETKEPVCPYRFKIAPRRGASDFGLHEISDSFGLRLV